MGIASNLLYRDLEVRSLWNWFGTARVGFLWRRDIVIPPLQRELANLLREKLCHPSRGIREVTKLSLNDVELNPPSSGWLKGTQGKRHNHKIDTFAIRAIFKVATIRMLDAKPPQLFIRNDCWKVRQLKSGLVEMCASMSHRHFGAPKQSIPACVTGSLFMKNLALFHWMACWWGGTRFAIPL